MNKKLKEKIQEINIAYKEYWDLAWVSILKKYISWLWKEFSYILKDKIFYWINEYKNDLYDSRKIAGSLAMLM